MIPLVVLLCASACDRRFEFKARPDESSYLRTDSAMIGNENQANKSSTSVGIPGF
jgi:hypothetical protein